MTATNNPPEDDPRIFSLKLDAVLDKDCWHLCKVVALQLAKTTYASVPMFFKNLPQRQLDELLDKIFYVNSLKDANDDKSVVRRRADLVLLSMLLAAAEGQTTFTSEEATLLLNKLILFSNLTDMHNNDLIGACFDKFNMTETLSDPGTLFKVSKGEST